jgi:hypothetical protein
MWPFSGWGKRSIQLPENEVKRVKRNCRNSLTAYAACTRSNVGIPLACDRLENKVVECLASQCQECAEDVEKFRACLQSMSFNVDSITGTECQKQVDAMRKCVQRLNLV